MMYSNGNRSEAANVNGFLWRGGNWFTSTQIWMVPICAYWYACSPVLLSRSQGILVCQVSWKMSCSLKENHRRETERRGGASSTQWRVDERSSQRRRNFLLAINLSRQETYTYQKCIQTNRQREVAHMKRIFFFLAALLLGRAFVRRMRERRASQYDWRVGQLSSYNKRVPSKGYPLDCLFTASMFYSSSGLTPSERNFFSSICAFCSDNRSFCSRASASVRRRWSLFS